MAVDKSSPIPRYYQLAESIREQIESGELKPGDRLPSERELGESAGISRMTIRQALAYLARKGSLEVRPGIGTFVAHPKLTYDALHLLGFTEEMMKQRRKPGSRVLEQAAVAPPPGVMARLGLGPGETVTKIVRLRLSAQTPLLLETVYIPQALCPGLEREDLRGAGKSLYALLEERYDLRLEHARQTLEAVTANDYEARLFGVAPGTPMILLEGLTYISGDRPIELFKAVYRGDQFKFELESRRTNGALGPSNPSRVSVRLTAEHA